MSIIKFAERNGNSQSLKVVNNIRALVLVIDCPHCSIEQFGFLQHPAGEKHTCDDCGKEYSVNHDAVIEYNG